MASLPWSTKNLALQDGTPKSVYLGTLEGLALAKVNLGSFYALELYALELHALEVITHCALETLYVVPWKLHCALVKHSSFLGLVCLVIV